MDVPQARHQHVFGSFQFLQETFPDILSITVFFILLLAKPIFLQVADILLGLVELVGGVGEAEPGLLQLDLLLLERALSCNQGCLGCLQI